MAESLPVGIFRTDSQGNCFFVNRCWCKLSGLTSEQAEGQGWLSSIDPDDLKQVRIEWRSCLKEGKEFRSQFRLATSRMTWVLGQAIAERDSRGNFVGYFGTLTEITEQKRAEEALRVNEARFRSAFGFAPHGMALVSPAGHFLQVNRLLCQMLGYSESELLQLRFQDISHPDELEASIAATQDLIGGRIQVFDIEKKYLHKDGSLVWAHIRSNLVRDSASQPLYFVSHVEDISERKHAEQALRESEQRYYRLVELSHDGILIHCQGKLVFLNPAAAKILGAASAEEMINRNVLDLVHPDYRAIVEKRIQQLSQGATFQPFLRQKLVKLDGSEVDVESAGIPFVYKGQPAIQVIFRDVTEITRADEEKNRLFREVETARDQLQSLSRRLVQVQELERRRIARELHDEIGQELTALRLNIEQGAALAGEEAQDICREAQARVNRLLGGIRELSLDLRPTMLDDLGLLPALIWQFDRYAAFSEIKVQFKHWGLESRRFGSLCQIRIGRHSARAAEWIVRPQQKGRRRGTRRPATSWEMVFSRRERSA